MIFSRIGSVRRFFIKGPNNFKLFYFYFYVHGPNSLGPDLKL